MALSWNEIKDRAIKFSKEWENAFNEDADAKPFLVDFFNVFGISQRKIGTFEQRVLKLDEHDGYIDMIWKGTLLIEMKSKGKNLDKAYQQAFDYLPGLKQHELPKFIIVSDFDIIRLYSLEENQNLIVEFRLNEFVNHVQHFGFIAGYQKRIYKEQDPVNIKAAEMMGKLYDKLKAVGYDGHPLEIYLVRLLFCLFADDTSIFNKDIFIDFIEQKTSEDGSDLAARLNELFYILNTSKEKRLKNIDEHLNEFPYVNGKLFEELLPPASFDKEMRRILIDCSYLDWGKISPAIFGSMFQSVMDPEKRRNIGAHYTSEKNILKLIKPLFIDDLWAEFETVKGNRNKLNEFHKKISSLKFLDPACGCGNFLVITYRELRLLELEILRALKKTDDKHLDISMIIHLDVDMMFGIEYEEFPARISEVAMWLIDHQMNMLVSQEFGQYFLRLPLKKSANIIQGNALQLDWESVVSKDKLSYILGNPPFIGSKMMKQNQRDEIVELFDNSEGSGTLDYVTGWYIKSAKFINGTQVKVAFVSTNSIVQGEQVSTLWEQMLNRFNIKIHFAHRTFKWSNEAKGMAAVYCVIIGFASYNTTNKKIFEYQDIKGEPHELKVKNINPYLVDAKDMLIKKRNNPICGVSEISFGNMPNDGGNFLFTDEEKKFFLTIEPNAEPYFRQILSAYEFLNGKKRWCLWLENISPTELKQLKEVQKRVQNVKNERSKSSRLSTRKLAEYPTLFGEIRQPRSDYILIPRHSSENRKYIPMGFFTNDYIVSDSCLAIDSATPYEFGILHSQMHMTWVKHVCGRIKSDFRYSNIVVYNNFPWPEKPNEKQKKEVEKASQKVLNARLEFPESSLADLYDPLTMPPVLVKAHQELDKAVDLCYRPQPFTSESNRMEFLFDLYEKYTSNLFRKEKPKKKKIK